MTALIRQGGTEFATSEDPHDIELWAEGKWRATWNDKETLPFPWPSVGVFNNMLNMAFEEGERARSKELRKLIGA